LGAETVPCRRPTALDGTYTYKLTKTTTNQVISIDGPDDQPGVALLHAIPPGTYQLTEIMPNGDEATSGVFTIEPDTRSFEIVVRNFTDQPVVPVDPAEVGSLVLRAFNCIDDARAGTFEYYFTNSALFFGKIYPTAASTTCVPVPPDEYSFTLTSDPETIGVTDAVAYDFVMDVSNAVTIYRPDTPTGEVPQGSYVISEAHTGYTSAPIIISSASNEVTFYVYQAASTPTPTVTPTATITPTATVTPTIDPDATATVTATIDPNATATANVTATSDPNATATPAGTRTPGEITPPGDKSTSTTAPGNAEGVVNDGSGSGVTALPSTGQGEDSGSSSGLSLLLGLALGFLVGAAALARKSRTP
jgi:hypothetical protein